MPGALIDGHCIGVQHVSYEVAGWGVGELWLEDGTVLSHDLPRAAIPRGQVLQSSSGVGMQDLTPVVQDLTPVVKRSDDLPCEAIPRGQTPGHSASCLVHRIEAYFAGESDTFADVELDLSWATPFQLAVAEALRAVPYGEVVTYGELAALAGHPNAQRAAGTFCAHNRFALFVPCHRVVAADGLGSYGSLGVEFKRRLLALEGHASL
jgi:methylated-DNA-[protein]-cysteine S-methyltransferase